MATANDTAAARPPYVHVRAKIWSETTLTPAQQVQLVTLEEAITGLRDLADSFREDFERRTDAADGGPEYARLNNCRLGAMYGTQALLLSSAELAIDRMMDEFWDRGTR